MPFIAQLLTSLDARLDELASEISTLQHARAEVKKPALTVARTSAASSGAPARPSRRATAKPKPPPRTSLPAAAVKKPEPTEASPARPKSNASGPRRRVADGARLSEGDAASLSGERLGRLLVSAGSGGSGASIVERTGVPRVRVLVLLRELQAAGKVRRTGQRRSTLWSSVTDEHRIADRTAQLERQFAARRDDRTQRRGRARAS